MSADDRPEVRDTRAKPKVLQAALGSSLLMARPFDRRLHLLDATAAVLWDLASNGWPPAALADLLVAHFGIGQEQALAHVQAQQTLWRDVGLLEPFEAADSPDGAGDWRLDRPDDPVWPPVNPRPLPLGARRLWVADRSVGLCCDDPLLDRLMDQSLCARVAAGPPQGNLTPTGDKVDAAHPWRRSEHTTLAHAGRGPDGSVDHVLVLQGSAEAWCLTLDGTLIQAGTSAGTALVATLMTLTELGCRPTERLLVVHGAGLVAPDGQGLLLVAPGGSGKTTLATALDAAGFGILSDDVVPVTPAGELLGLGLPLCLKPGSWPVVQDRRPDLVDGPQVRRFGRQVRYLPPQNLAAGAVVATSVLVLSRYAPEEPPGHERISAEQALQGLVEAEAVVRNLTQRKLEALAHWLGSMSAYRLNYPDLDTGLRLVQRVLRTCAAGDGSPREPAHTAQSCDAQGAAQGAAQPRWN